MDIVPTRNKEGHCIVCNKKLSQFNLTEYCFNHQHLKTKVEDEKKMAKNKTMSDYYRKLNRERYWKKKDARMDKDTKASKKVRD